jgi:hypothetical protein
VRLKFVAVCNGGVAFVMFSSALHGRSWTLLSSCKPAPIQGTAAAAATAATATISAAAPGLVMHETPSRAARVLHTFLPQTLKLLPLLPLLLPGVRVTYGAPSRAASPLSSPA